MQISRHWRLNSQRYRLQGVRHENGTVSVQALLAPPKGSKPAQLSDPQMKLIKAQKIAAT
jgi:hypothetical protein